MFHSSGIEHHFGLKHSYFRETNVKCASLKVDITEMGCTVGTVLLQ